MNESSRPSCSLNAVIDRFEGMTAVLRIEGGQEVRWPTKFLPDQVREGTVVRLTLASELTEEREREQVARTILNELLK